MSQRKSPRLRKGRNSNPSPPSSDHEEEASPPREEEGDDLDELFAHESTVFQEMRSYQTSPHHPHQAHQVTAPSPKKGGRRRSLVVPDDEKTYTPKRTRRITASQITSSGRKRTRKASQTSPTQSAKSPKKRKIKEPRMSEDLVEEIDFWKNLKEESLAVKKGPAVSPTKLVLCRPRETLHLSDSDEEIANVSSPVPTKEDEVLTPIVDTQPNIPEEPTKPADEATEDKGEEEEEEGSPVIVDSQTLAEEDQDQNQDEEKEKTIQKTDSFDLFERSDDEE